MARIVVNTQNGLLENSRSYSIRNLNIVQGKHFNEFIATQKIGVKPDGKYKREGLSDAGAAHLREETEHILARCNPHDAVDNLEATHLVVGYVQSGKTMSFTALTALAADNNYRIIIYLAGSKRNLLNQTANRLKKDLITTDGEKNRDVFKIHKDPQISDIHQIIGNLNLPGAVLLIPILKHYRHIEDLREIFKDSKFKETLGDETVLIIDDEADQVSLNSYGRKNSARNEEEEDERSKTYDAIFKMRVSLPGNSYIQYTATPQANLLIDIKDILSPQSHTLLTPGEDYMGGLQFFGPRGRVMYDGRLVNEIPTGEVYHKKNNPLLGMPHSLNDALLMHIISVAFVVKYLKREGVKYLSMMVHPAVDKKSNEKFKKWIESQLGSWRDIMQKEDGHDDKQSLIEKLRKLYPYTLEFYSGVIPEFDIVLPLIKDVLNSWKIYLVNTAPDAETEIDWDDYCMHILVGAEMLNRGFTIENLTTTYMPRYSSGRDNADTIQQRCRFFGYKKNYIEFCRVYLPSKTIEEYKDYVEYEEELRSALSTCDTFAEAERTIMLSPSMNPTRKNVLPKSLITTPLVGRKELQAFDSRALIESNKLLVKQFIEKHEKDFDIPYEYGTADRSHRGLRLPVNEAISFLEDFRFGKYEDVKRRTLAIRYLRYLSEKPGDEALRCIYFIQMAYKHEETGALRERKFDCDSFKVDRMATGMDPGGGGTYPGDAKIVEDDSITIQLFHIKLKGVQIDFPDDAFSIAINYPEHLGTNYVSNESSRNDGKVKSINE